MVMAETGYLTLDQDMMSRVLANAWACLSTGNRGFWYTEAGGSADVIAVPPRELMYPNSRSIAAVMLKSADQ